MKRLATVALAGLLAGCITPPPAPPAPYYARGNQPGWSLIIDEQHVTFIRADQSMLRDPRPSPVNTAAGSSYQSPRIRVTIVRNLCRDASTGQIYPHQVHVNAEGRSFHGCGGM